MNTIKALIFDNFLRFIAPFIIKISYNYRSTQHMCVEKRFRKKICFSNLKEMRREAANLWVILMKLWFFFVTGFFAILYFIFFINLTGLTRLYTYTIICNYILLFYSSRNKWIYDEHNQSDKLSSFYGEKCLNFYFLNNIIKVYGQGISSGDPEIII